MDNTNSDPKYYSGVGLRSTGGRTKRQEFQVLWLQRGQSVNDQIFDSYAIFAKEKRHKILTSRRTERKGLNSKEGKPHPAKHIITSITKSSEYLAVVGTLVSVVGFVLQFTGLRAMHWSATIAQLTVTLFMTVLRAWVRRRLSLHQSFQQVPDQYEMEWLAARVVRNLESLLEEEHDTKYKGDFGWEWRIDAVDTIGGKVLWDPNTSPLLPTKEQRAIKVRERLGYLTRWTGPASKPAVSVAIAIEGVMKHLTFGSRLDCTNKLMLLIKTRAGDESAGDIYLTLRRQHKLQPWKADSTEIEAFLSFCLYAVDEREKHTKSQSDWLRQEGLGPRKHSLRLLGPNENILCRDMEWWMCGNVSSIIQVEELSQTGPEELNILLEHINIDQHRILGRSDLRAPGSRLPMSSRWKYKKAMLSCGNSSDERHKFQTLDRYPQLATFSNLSLQGSFAQDLFSSFMYTIAGIADPVSGNTTIHQRDQIDTSLLVNSFTFEDSTLSKIVQGVESSGLAISDEAFMSIIPPLSINNLLPDISALIETARNRAESPLSIGNWRGAGDVYIELVTIFNESNRLARKVSYIKSLTKVIALTMGFQILLDNSIKIWGKEADGLYSGLDLTLETTLDSTNLGYLADTIRGLYKRLSLSKQPRIPKPKMARRIIKDSKLFREKNLKDKMILGITPHHALVIDGFDTIDDSLFWRFGTSYSWCPDIHTIDITGRTPLHYLATSNGIQRRKLYKLLYGADYNAQDINKWTPLHYCAWNGDLEASKFLLRKSDVGKRGITGITPLHCAAQQGHSEIVRLLVNEAADVNALDIAKVAPLHCAAHRGFSSIVAILLDSKADPNSRNK